MGTIKFPLLYCDGIFECNNISAKIPIDLLANSIRSGRQYILQLRRSLGSSQFVTMFIESDRLEALNAHPARYGNSAVGSFVKRGWQCSGGRATNFPCGQRGVDCPFVDCFEELDNEIILVIIL